MHHLPCTPLGLQLTPRIPGILKRATPRVQLVYWRCRMIWTIEDSGEYLSRRMLSLSPHRSSSSSNNTSNTSPSSTSPNNTSLSSTSDPNLDLKPNPSPPLNFPLRRKNSQLQIATTAEWTWACTEADMPETCSMATRSALQEPPLKTLPGHCRLHKAKGPNTRRFLRCRLTMEALEVFCRLRLIA